MNGWQIVRLEECCEIVSGATPSTSVDNYWNGDICWATPKDLSDLGDGTFISDTPRKITQAGLEACAATILPAGSVLFSSRAPIGHVAVNTVPMATNQGFKSFVPKAGRVDAKFLYWWLRSNRPYLEGLGNGATFKEVSKSIVARVEMRVPPLTEQRRIAAILDKADELRAKRRAALTQLEILIQDIFFSVFGNPVVSQAEWPITLLTEVCEKITDGTHNSPPIQAKGVPYVTAKHLKEHGLDFESDPWFISKEDHLPIFARCDPRYGDVLYIKDGATTGIAAINHYSFEFSMLSSLALIRPKPAKLVAEYLCFWLNNPLVKRELLGGMAGAAIRRLTIAKLKAIRIPIPSVALQRKFASRVCAVEKLNATYRASLAEMDALFASLQYRAFRGEL